MNYLHEVHKLKAQQRGRVYVRIFNLRNHSTDLKQIWYLGVYVKTCRVNSTFLHINLAYLTPIEDQTPNIGIERLAFLCRIREVPGSNHGLNTTTVIEVFHCFLPPGK